MPQKVEVSLDLLNILDRKLVLVCLPPDFQDIDTIGYQQQLVKLLFSQEARGEIVFLGAWRQCKLVPFQSSTFHFDHGRNLKSHPDWEFYFSKLGKWEVSFELPLDVRTNAYTEELIPGRGDREVWALYTTCEALATNTLGHALGASVSIHYSNTMNRWTNEEYRCGKSILLPLSQALGAQTAVELLLTHRYGLSSESPPPPWLEQVPRLSAELAAVNELNALEAQRAELESRIASAEAEVRKQRETLKLLFSTGAELESVVCKSLQVLGAVNLIEEPRGNQEDAIFSDPQGREYILEIKGLKKSAKLDELRQLHLFREDRWSSGLDGSPRKPVMLVNHELEKAPSVRRPDCVGSAADAKRLGHACVSTLQLYQALLAHDRGQLDLDRLWESIYNTAGLWDESIIIPS